MLNLKAIISIYKELREDFKGITATRKELRKAGYFYTAKLIILRNLNRQKK